MAKGKYERWRNEEGQALLKGWARDGLSEEQIARNMGISRSTLSEWKNRFPDISDAIKKGKEVADYEVENALFKKACSGDVGACCFWLTNRRPDKWKNRIKETHEVEENKKDLLSDIREEMDRIKAGDAP